MYNLLLALFGCFVLAGGYVSSLYIWGSRSNRNHPDTIKRRFFSCSVIMVVSPFFVRWVVGNMGYDESIFDLLGLRTDGIVYACFLPLLLTAILFLGPLLQFFWDDSDEDVFSLEELKDLVWWRNHVVAPLSEEFIFRSCILAVLILRFTPQSAIALSSFVFGFAHIHHVFSNLYEGYNLKAASLITGFQVIYTSLFGAYSAFLFLRTGHFVAPFLAHAFCNHMGFPNVHQVLTLSEPKRSIIGITYVVGLVSWIYLIVPATNPELYSNNLHWKPH